MKLRWRAAASKARNPFSDGSLAVISVAPQMHEYISCEEICKCRLSNAEIATIFPLTGYLEEDKMSIYSRINR